MSYRIAGLAAAAFVVVVVPAPAAWAGPVYWTPPAGTTSRLTYSDGQEDKGLYGNPTVAGNTFEFLTPHDFSADAADGSARTTSDRTSVKVAARTGSSLTGVNVIETGDWSVLGGGGFAAVKETGLLLATRTDAGHFGVSYSLTPTVTYFDDDTNTTATAYPTANGSGTWRAVYFLTLPAGVASLQVTLNNNLQAASSAGTTAFIQKKLVEIDVLTPTTPSSLTPEPAALGVIGLAAMLLPRRRARA